MDRTTFRPAIYLVLSILLMHSPLILNAHASDKHVESRQSGEGVVINFKDVDIKSIVRFISEKTGKNFIYDGRLKGKVTIIAPSRLTIEDAFDLFISILELKGYAIVNMGKAYKIIPARDVKQGSLRVLSGVKEGARVKDSYMVRLIPLNFVQAVELQPILRPLVSRQGYLSAFGKGNALLLIDTAMNIKKILDIIRILDVKSAAYRPEIVYLKYARAETVASALQKYGEGKGRLRTKRRAPVVKRVSPIADTRLNAVILINAPEVKEEYKRIIALMDVPMPETTSRINVYYLENADAKEISKVLNGLIKNAPLQKASDKTSTATKFAERIRIIPDSATNSLIIVSSPEDYQNLVKVIQKLDRRPRQVLVEAMIVEVSISNALELGAKWRAAATRGGRPLVIGGLGSVDVSAIQNIISGMAGLTIGGVANFLTIPVTKADGTTTNLTAPGFAALFSLDEFKDVVNVLSTPHILTSNNREAEIIVGENVPFLSRFERQATTTNQPLLQSIERKDVGITLKIKPQISEGGYVKLDIYEEISALAPTSQLGGVQASDIITTKRSAKTTVVVKDKQTVVIGGLIQDRETESIRKIPFFSDIPLLGALFRYRSTRKQKTNLLVYLTPRIAENFDRLDELRKERERIFRGRDKEPIEKDKEE